MPMGRSGFAMAVSPSSLKTWNEMFFFFQLLAIIFV